METATAKVMATPLAATRQSEPSHQQATKQVPTKRHKRRKKHKKDSENFLCLLCFLCLFVASFLLRGEFSFLFFVEALLIFLEPAFEIVCGFLEFVAIQQPAPECLKKRSRANVVSEFLVRFLIGALRERHEEFFIKRGEAAFDAAQTQRTLACDGPIRKSEREIVKSFSFKLSQQWPLE